MIIIAIIQAHVKPGQGFQTRVVFAQNDASVSQHKGLLFSKKETSIFYWLKFT